MVKIAAQVKALFSRTIEYPRGDINNRLNRVAGSWNNGRFSREGATQK
jgi:hypothetical protein